MKRATMVALVAALTILPVSLSYAQTSNSGPNSGLPGGNTQSDTGKPANGNHGNNGSNGG